jgi:glyoxylase-like metal-dependent hydrolase (beta-lactamase superfamily II)
MIHCLQTGLLGVNTYFVPTHPDSADVFIVDPGGEPDKIAQFLSDHQLSPHAIVLTHGHFDHLGAVPFLFQNYPSLEICINPHDSMYLGACGWALHEQDFAAINLAYLVMEVRSQGLVLPTVTNELHHNQSLSFASDWRVFHTPGHSPGSICLYNKSESVLFSGDTLFAGSYGRTDLRGGSFPKIQESLFFLLGLPPETTVYPGHGGKTTIGFERELLRY